MSNDERLYVLKMLCRPLQQEGWPKPVRKRWLLGHSAEDPGVDENYVEYQLTSLLRGGYIHEHDENAIAIHPSGVMEYETLCGDRVSMDGSVTELLACLDEHDDAEKPGVARTTLLRELGRSETKVDGIVWFLEERGDLTTISGRREAFLTARLTEQGRERIEESD